MSNNKVSAPAANEGPATGSNKSHGRFLGTLRDALAAAGRDDTLDPAKSVQGSRPASAASDKLAMAAAETPQVSSASSDQTVRSSAVTPDVAASVKTPQMSAAPDGASGGNKPAVSTGSVAERRHVEAAQPAAADLRPGLTKSDDDSPRTQLIRGKHKVVRSNFHQDPVVAWLVVIGGPGLGAYRPIFEGNNTIGRTANQRIAIDFGDETISSEEQAYIRYDSADRKYLFVPNLAKTNIVQINDSKPTAAVELAAMDVITMGHTQLVFVPFCGEEFDWSELAGLKE